MLKAALSLIAFALTFAIGSAASAHHPAKMERCVSVTFTGQLERIEWRRPHVELFIRTDEDTIHQVTWLAINQLHLAGIYQDTLRIGDQVEIVAGILPDDVVERPMLLSYIHRQSDDWGWSQRPQGC